MAEVLGARSCILVKDVEGLYTEDPRIPLKEDFARIPAGGNEPSYKGRPEIRDD